MNKPFFSSVIAMCLSAVATNVHAVDVDITSMIFGAVYTAEGQVRDNPDNLGVFQSTEDFVANPWAAVAIAYFDSGAILEDDDLVPDKVWLEDNDNGTSTEFGPFSQLTSYDAGTGIYTWSGMSVSGFDGVQIPFEYTFTLDANQIAWGTLFNWSVNYGIPVLNVMDCTDLANCVGVPGTPMVNGPFSGQDPTFNGGLPPISCADGFTSTNPDEAVDIDITTEVFTLCSNSQPPVVLDSFTQPTNGVVSENAGVLTYAPDGGFVGTDGFTYTVSDSANTATPANFDIQVGGELLGNFTMLDSNGDVFGGTNDVVFVWDGISVNVDEADTNFGLIEIFSARPQPFNSFIWTAHHIRVFGPGTYTFDTACTKAQYDAGTTSCGGSAPLSMTVGDGQYGAHILFDWSTSDDIDVVNVWNQNAQWDRLGNTGNTNKLFLGAAGVTPAEDANWELVSTDVNGDTMNGAPMVDGPFQGFYANFNNQPDKSGSPAEPYTGTAQDTKLGSSLLASMNIIGLFISVMMLIGLRQLNRKK